MFRLKWQVQESEIEGLKLQTSHRIGRRALLETKVYTYEGISVRVVEARDLERIRTLRNDPSTWMNLTDIQMISAPMQEQWFARIAAATDRKYFVVFDAEHDFIGIVRCDEIDLLNRSIRIGCDIVPELRRQHYGSRTYDLMLKYCFDFLNMHRVWLLVIGTNTIAIRLYGNKGFCKEGRYREALFRDGRYHDYIVMSILEDEYRRSPTENTHEQNCNV